MQALGAQGEYLATILGDTDRMFELGRKRAVAGDRGPTVVEQFHVGPADIDHWLDSEKHSGPQLGAGTWPADMDDLGRIMKHPAEAMAAPEALSPEPFFAKIMRPSAILNSAPYCLASWVP